MKTNQITKGDIIGTQSLVALYILAFFSERLKPAIIWSSRNSFQLKEKRSGQSKFYTILNNEIWHKYAIYKILEKYKMMIYENITIFYNYIDVTNVYQFILCGINLPGASCFSSKVNVNYMFYKAAHYLQSHGTLPRRCNKWFNVFIRLLSFLVDTFFPDLLVPFLSDIVSLLCFLLKSHDASILKVTELKASYSQTSGNNLCSEVLNISICEMIFSEQAQLVTLVCHIAYSNYRNICILKWLKNYSFIKGDAIPFSKSCRGIHDKFLVPKRYAIIFS